MRIVHILIGSLILISFAASALAETIDTFGSGESQFSIVFVPIGNPGNAADTTGAPNPAGSVDYHYRMGKYEISRDMIEKANTTGGLGITLHSMSSVNGTLGSGPRANMPATGVSLYEAARFVNWLNISQGFSPAYRFQLQPGQSGYNSNENFESWPSAEPGFNPLNVYRNKHAKYFIPSVNEWYKAAYYDPSANGGSGRYWDYPTGSDMGPTAIPSGTASGTAVHSQPWDQGPADIFSAGGMSPYGVMAMAGNVKENLETIEPAGGCCPFAHVFRGGDWRCSDFNLWGPDCGMRSNSQGARYGFFGDDNYGFRIARSHALLTSAFLFHSGWSGEGEGIDLSKLLHREGSGIIRLSFDNLINSSLGINGIGFDVQHLANGALIDSQDFIFQVSPQGAFSEILNPPANWPIAPAPSSIEVTAISEIDSLSRVSITWHNSQIENRWLRITMKANSNTGLMYPEVFYLGHLRGETTGPDGASYTVSFADISAIRETVGQTVDASGITDIDKNGVVSFADISAMRNNISAVLTNITVP